MPHDGLSNLTIRSTSYQRISAQPPRFLPLKVQPKEHALYTFLAYTAQRGTHGTDTAGLVIGWSWFWSTAPKTACEFPPFIIVVGAYFIVEKTP